MGKEIGAVGIVPPRMKLGLLPGRLPLDTLIWPMGQPDRLRGRQLHHMTCHDHLLMGPRTTSYYRPGFGTRANVSVMMLEPRIVQERHVRQLRRFHWRFHKVLSAVEADLVDRIPNGAFFPFGSTWIQDPEDLDTTKRYMVSLIASAKRSQPGHLVRHEIVGWSRAEGIELQALGGGYRPFEKKYEGLAPYRFSVVIENSMEPNYFTEKLIDAILCDCVPIYLGCPNIERFFDISGMIVCKNADDVRDAVKSASEELYLDKISALRAIKPKAAHLGAVNQRAARLLLEGAAA
jgi:glycosyl transferase family 10 (putative fucosyltransferase)